MWARTPVPRLESTSLSTLFPGGVGIVGRVWEHGGSEWLEDLQDDSFLRHRAAAADRLSCGGAFVATSAGRPVGVVECFRSSGRSRHDPFVGAPGTGAIIGALLDRGVAEEERHELLRAVQRERTRLSAVLEQLPLGVILSDPAGGTEDWNPAVDRMLGPADAAGRHVVQPIDGPPLALDAFGPPDANREPSESTEVAHDAQTDVEVVDADGGRLALSIATTPVRGSTGDVVARVTTIVDVTEERARSARSELLAEAGELFARSLDIDETLRAVAQLCVPRIADLCVVHLVDTGRGTGVPTRDAALAVAVDEMAAALGALDQADWTSHLARSIVDRVARSRTPIVLDQIDDRVLRLVAADDEHLRVLRSLGLRQIVAVPLIGRDEVHGAMLFAARAGDRFTPPLVELATELGRRAGLAVSNARLYQRSRSIADALQASLLPPELPEVPGLDIAATFVAGGDGLIVGGDFYDVFAVDEEGWAFVVGDVCGKGAEAAAVTARVRYTARAVPERDDPGALMRRLNATLLEQDPNPMRFCTLVYGTVVPGVDGAEVHVGVGGHPPPMVLRADGRVETLTCRGTLLGVLDHVAHETTRVTLAPGDALVTYTDGVTEARGPSGMFGEEGLHGALGSVAGSSGGATAAEIVEHVRGAVVEHAGHRIGDDVALLVVRVPRSDA